MRGVGHMQLLGHQLTVLDLILADFCLGSEEGEVQ